MAGLYRVMNVRRDWVALGGRISAFFQLSLCHLFQMEMLQVGPKGDLILGTDKVRLQTWLV
jgi:hypothetical protein